MSDNAISVTIGLMIAFGLFVLYTRWRNWLDSNVPVFYYIALIALMRSLDGPVPIWLILVSFALALTLRFEFMNPTFTKIVKFIEFCTLAVIIYLCFQMMRLG
jgi:hypothetical protein